MYFIIFLKLNNLILTVSGKNRIGQLLISKEFCIARER